MKPRPIEDNTHAVEIVNEAYAGMTVDDDPHGLEILSSVYCHVTGGDDQICYDSVKYWLESRGEGS